MIKDKIINDLRVLRRWVTDKPAETFDDVEELGGRLNWSLDEGLTETLMYLTGERYEVPFLNSVAEQEDRMKESKPMWVPTVPLRGPSPAELHELAKCVTKRDMTNPTLADLEEVEEQLGGAYVCVFPNYMTGSPGYCGKVYIIVWDGAPEFYDAFIEDKSKGCLEYITSEMSRGYDSVEVDSLKKETCGLKARLQSYGDIDGKFLESQTARAKAEGDNEKYARIVAQNNKLIDAICEVLSDPIMEDIDACAKINELVDNYNEMEVK